MCTRALSMRSRLPGGCSALYSMVSLTSKKPVRCSCMKARVKPERGQVVPEGGVEHAHVVHRVHVALVVAVPGIDHRPEGLDVLRHFRVPFNAAERACLLDAASPLRFRPLPAGACLRSVDRHDIQCAFAVRNSSIRSSNSPKRGL